MSLVQQRLNTLRNSASRGALRVDKDHAHDFFLELNEHEAPVLAIRLEQPPQAAIPKFRVFDVQLADRKDGSQLLSISLQDQRLYREFCLLCDSVVDSTRAVPKAQLGSYVLSELTHWRQLLQRDASEMSAEQLRGLLAELIVLEELIKSRGAHGAISGWGGPLQRPQDFAFPDRVLEAKSMLPPAHEIAISSLEQLDHTDARQFVLAVVSLKPEATDFPSALSIQRQIRAIESVSEADPEALDLFRAKLSFLGGPQRFGNDELFFSLQSVSTFEVRDGFPRIIRSDVNIGITKARYAIARDSISPFEIMLAAL